MVICLKKKGSAQPVDVEAGGNGGVLGDGYAPVDFNDILASANEDDDADPSSVENQNYVRNCRMFVLFNQLKLISLSLFS